MSDKNSGWVKLWRDQFVHEISERKPWCDGYAWSYLYSRANFRPAIVNWRNQYIHVERGQFITSKLKLQKIFGWSKKRTNSFLTSLEVGGMSTIRTTNRFIIITICNYDKYQSTEDEKGPTEGTIEGPTESQQRATTKNEKNEKKKRKTYLSGNELPDRSKAPSSSIPQCPQREIVNIYNDTLGHLLPRVKLSLWPGSPREKHLQARWREDTHRQSIKFWEGLFLYIRDQCPFLTGNGNKEWRADLDWIVKKENLIKVQEGKYEREQRQ